MQLGESKLWNVATGQVRVGYGTQAIRLLHSFTPDGRDLLMIYRLRLRNPNVSSGFHVKSCGRSRIDTVDAHKQELCRATGKEEGARDKADFETNRMRKAIACTWTGISPQALVSCAVGAEFEEVSAMEFESSEELLKFVAFIAGDIERIVIPGGDAVEISFEGKRPVVYPTKNIGMLLCTYAKEVMAVSKKDAELILRNGILTSQGIRADVGGGALRRAS
jgi:hypothetical protein